MANYDLTALARQDLDDIYTYGIMQWGLRQADNYYDALLSQLDQIAEAPLRNAVVKHISNDARRRVFRSHANYYETGKETVRILSIIRSQDLSRLK